MKFLTLLQSLPAFKKTDDLNPEILGISEDSRNIKKNYLFIALKGFNVDGHKYISEAIKNGAVAVVGEKPLKNINLPENVSYVNVNDSRKVIGVLASRFYDDPSKKMKIIGVTGSDGKTTTATLIHHLLTKSGIKSGLVTSVGAKIGKEEYDTGFHVTTPDPVLLQIFIRKMVDSKCEIAVIEVTSHGLDQERVAGIDFDIGVLTNISREHLDYHKTYGNYVKAKALLFNRSKYAIINKDDYSYKFVKKLINKNVKTISYDLKTPSKIARSEIIKKFPEIYNQFNATAAYLAVKKCGLSDQDFNKSIKTFSGVVGRMEKVKNNKGLKIFIDFAHTPNALESVLTELVNRKNISQKLIVVFGCASERDDSKRPMMGEISGRLADVSIFTAEDPRYEDINEILIAMEKGARKGNAKKIQFDNVNQKIFDKTLNKSDKHFYIKVPERGAAISLAINKIANKNDIIVICGKGHEKSMAYNGIEYPWSDKNATKMALKEKVLEIKR